MERMSSLILLLLRLVFSHYEFLVVFRKVQVLDRKVQGWCGLGWCAGWECSRFLQLLWVQSMVKFCRYRQKIPTCAGLYHITNELSLAGCKKQLVLSKNSTFNYEG